MAKVTMGKVALVWHVAMGLLCVGCAVLAPMAYQRVYFAILAAANVLFAMRPWWSRRRAQRCVLTVGVRVNAFGRCFIVKSVSGQNVVLDELPEVE